MVTQSERRRLLALGVIGVAIFIAGVVTAVHRLPEWRNPSVPDASFFTARLQPAAREAGLELESAPGAQLMSRGWLYEDNALALHETAYDSLGPKASDWLAREGRGPFVEVTARSHWLSNGLENGTTGGVRNATTRKEDGEFRVLFSLRGVPVSAIWMPNDPLRSSSNRNLDGTQRREALARMLMSGDATRTLQRPPTPVFLPEVGMLTATLTLASVPGSAPQETVIAATLTTAAAAYGQRVVGSADWWRNRFEGLSLGSVIHANLPRFVIRGGLFLGTVALFILLLARRRIELTKGAIIGATSIVLSLSTPIQSSATWVQLVDPILFILGKGFWLFVLWSAAESWVRSTIPGFRTSLDALRAGRLGPTGGRAMLAGWSIGAGTAGWWLIALSVSTLVRGVSPTDASVRLPIFDANVSPIDEGVYRTGVVLLAICAALRLPLLRRFRWSAPVIAALVLATRAPLSSLWMALPIALVLAVVFVRTYAGFGLTALLVAAVTSAVLPSALFSLIHFSWLTSSALLLVAIAVAPLPFGLIGLRRRDEVEEGAVPLPTFVRLLEEENRLKYEMDLLARMQLGLLPREMPRIEGYEIAAQSILATEAGGDLYDFVYDDLGRIWIAAGDVSGHGYSCAIAQAMTKAGLASLVEVDRTPATVLGRLDLVLRGIDAPRTFTSLALLRLDPATGQALVSNAGHPYPCIASDGQVRELELPSLPLGQGPERRYVDALLSIGIGTTVLFCSDGLFEGTDAAGRPYGFERIHQILGSLSALPAPAIVAAIIEDWRSHVGSGAPADDTTIVVIRRSS
jgi:hypothetical protein